MAWILVLEIIQEVALQVLSFQKDGICISKFLFFDDDSIEMHNFLQVFM